MVAHGFATGSRCGCGNGSGSGLDLLTALGMAAAYAVGAALLCLLCFRLRLRLADRADAADALRYRAELARVNQLVGPLLQEEPALLDMHDRDIPSMGGDNSRLAGDLFAMRRIAS